MRSIVSRGVGIVLLGSVAACHDPGPSQESEPPQNLALKAVNILPPGESGLFTAEGQAAGKVNGKDPAAYGANVDDQRILYWSFDYKDGSFRTPLAGTSLAANPNVSVSVDAYGVPAIFADKVFDLQYGAGYVTAQQRLFLMDEVRRSGRGTLAELFGCGFVPTDLQTRVLTYTPAEYQTFFDHLSQDSKDAVRGYVAGVNQWITELSSHPDQMPAEYQLFSSQPQPLEIQDVLAVGVLLTRSVAAEGGNEFLNIRMLKLLQDKYGAGPGRQAFLDLDWDEDRKAVTAVPPDQEFSNQDMPPGGRAAAFDARADWALTLPETIWKGDGTGSAPQPSPCGPVATPPGALNPAAAAIVTRIQDFPKTLHGGSFAVAIGRVRTRAHGALLISEPQVGYTYPSLLYELELHGAGYDVRGVSTPGSPSVGLGYTPNIAWALTTGYSKTIDSFIEKICSDSQAQAGSCRKNQYFHNGHWKDMDCRTETINYRPRDPRTGAPFGPPNLSASYEACRTVHGPIVARDNARGLARSVSYAMWKHETENGEGIRGWIRAKNLDQFVAATSTLTWNENVTFATRTGDIGYIHPGRYPVRPPESDQRFPSPGTGEADFQGILPFSRMPKSINPEQGYLANWNTKPALGWLDGEGISSTSRPGGPGQRVTSLLDTLATRRDWSFEDLPTIDRIAGTRDPRARQYLPVMFSFENTVSDDLSPTERQALALLRAWDRAHYGPITDLKDTQAKDDPAATVFAAWVDTLRQDLFGELDTLVLDDKDPCVQPGEADRQLTVYGRSRGVCKHLFEQSVMDNLIVRILEPSTSSLPVRFDWARGRRRDTVLHDTLAAALTTLANLYNNGQPLSPADFNKCRRIHPPSIINSVSKGAIGPSNVSMPYQDRGSWVQLVGYE